VLGVDHAGAESNRRYVPFADGAQAEDESATPGGQARLVGVPHHRWIEQGGRFQRVFLREERPDQQPPVLADRLIGGQVTLDRFKAVQEEFADPLVARAKLPHYILQKVFDLPLGEGRNARYDLLDPVLA
jgi:hypothetical protein